MKRCRFIIYFIIVMMMLLLTSCKVNLDIRLLDIVKDTCVCDEKRCECGDVYSEDYVYIDCNKFEGDVVSFTEVIKYCDYGNYVGGYNWDCTQDEVIKNDTRQAENESII